MYHGGSHVENPSFIVGNDLGNEQDEVQQVLDGLAALAQTTSSPIIRLCLEEASRDIAHLVGAVDDREEVKPRANDSSETERPVA
jgi:hypothetical protein